MTTLQMLTVRANAALGRLASLQRRAEKISSRDGLIARTALKELNDALELLRVANDQLQMQVDELATAKTNATVADRRLMEFFQMLPCACVWTNMSGEITDANAAAASLLNVSRQHLVGRPFMLFLAQRSSIQDAFSAFSSGAIRTADLDVDVRPRGRRARSVRVLGRRLDGGDHQLCWFLVENS